MRLEVDIKDAGRDADVENGHVDTAGGRGWDKLGK